MNKAKINGVFAPRGKKRYFSTHYSLCHTKVCFSQKEKQTFNACSRLQRIFSIEGMIKWKKQGKSKLLYALHKFFAFTFGWMKMHSH